MDARCAVGRTGRGERGLWNHGLAEVCGRLLAGNNRHFLGPQMSILKISTVVLNDGVEMFAPIGLS
jgi:hypothetical protein